jgi:hypothetical protein
MSSGNVRTDANNYNMVVSNSLSVRGNSGMCGDLVVSKTVYANEFKNSAGTASVPIGTVIQSLLTPAQMRKTSSGYVLADGRSVKGSPYQRLTGRNNVPDLRGYFTRAAKNPKVIGQVFPDSTALPNNGFVTTVSGEHTHLILSQSAGNVQVAISDPPDEGPAYATVKNLANTSVTTIGITESAGSHAHFVEGGDTETAPRHVTLNYYVFVGKKIKRYRCFQ